MATLTSLTLEADSRPIRRATRDVNELGRRGQAAGRDMGRFGQQTGRATAQTQRLSAAARTLTRVLGAVGIGLSVRAMQSFVSSTIDAANEIGKLSTATGISTTRLQELGFAFGQLADISDQQVNESLTRFSRRLDLARRETGAARNALEELGISLEQSTGAALNEVIATLEEMGETQAVVGIASELFGDRTGPQLAAALQQGIGAIDAQAESAHQLGVILREELIRDAEQTADEFRILSMTLQTSFQRAVLENADSIASMARGLQNMIGFVSENIELFRALGVALTTLLTIRAAQFFFSLNAAMTAAAAGAGALRTAMAFLGGPAGVIALAAGAISFFVSRTSDAETSTRSLSDQVALLTNNMTNLRRAEIQRALVDFERQADRARSEVNRFSNDVQEAQRLLEESDFGTETRSRNLRILQGELVRASAELFEAEAAISTAEQELRKLDETVDDSVDGVDQITTQFVTLEQAMRDVSDAALEVDDRLDSAFAAAIPAIDQLPPQMRNLQILVEQTGQSAQTMGDEFDQVAAQIESAFSDMFRDILRDGEVDFQSFADNLLSIFQRMIADMAAEQIMEGIMGDGGFQLLQPDGSATDLGVGVAGVAGGFAGQQIGGQTGGQLGSVGAAIGMASPIGLGGAALGAVAGGVLGGLFGGSESRRRDREQRRELEQLRDETQARLDNLQATTESERELLREKRRKEELTEARTAENRAIMEEIFLIEDQIREIERVNDINQERTNLERRFATLIEDTTTLRRLEMEATEAANRSLLRFIFRIEDQMEVVAEADRQAAQAEQNARQAFQSLRDSVRRQEALIQEQFDAPIRAIEQALSRIEGRRIADAGPADRRRAFSVVERARAEGVGAVDQNVLDRSLRIVAEPSEDLFETFVDFQRDTARTDRVLNDLLDDTKSVQEQQLDEIRSQLDQGQEMINALFGIDDSVLSVADAMENLAGAIGAAESARSAADSARSDLERMQEQAPSFEDAQPAPPPAPEPDDPDMLRITFNDRQGRQFTREVPEDERSRIQRIANSRGGRILNVDRFADGGIHSGGLRIVGERGPELEATGPSRVMNNEDLMAGLRGDHLVRELQDLRQEVAALRSEQSNSQYQIAKNTKRTKDTLEKFDIDGLPPERT